MTALSLAERRRVRRERKDEINALVAREQFKIPLRQRPMLIARAVLAGRILVFVAMGVYFFFTQTGIPMDWLISLLLHSHVHALEAWAIKAQAQAALEHLSMTNKAIWHALVPFDFYRHGYRGILEGIFAGVAALAVNVNLLSPAHLRRIHKPFNLLDKLEIYWLRVPNWKDNDWRKARGLPAPSGRQAAMAWLVWQWVYSLPFVWLLLHGFSWLANKALELGPWGEPIHDALLSPFSYIVIGLLVSPIAKRPLGPVLADIMEARAQHWVAGGRTKRWYHRVLWTPQYAELVRRTEAKGVAAAARAETRRGFGRTVATTAAIVVLFGFLVTGLYIQFFLK